MKKILIDLQCLQLCEDNNKSVNELSKFCFDMVIFFRDYFEVTVLIHSDLGNVFLLKHFYSEIKSCRIKFLRILDKNKLVYSEVNQFLYETTLVEDDYHAIIIPEINLTSYVLNKYLNLPIYAVARNLEHLDSRLKHNAAVVNKLLLINPALSILEQFKFLGLSNKFNCYDSSRELVDSLSVYLSRNINVEINVKKQKLAYCSPLPPEQTGIADYSLALLPFLSQFYNIILINNASNFDDYLVHNYSIKSYEYLVDNYSDFDRVIYHFGNSHFHLDMFNALALAPGIVMMHDSNISDFMRYYFHHRAVDSVIYCLENKLYHLLNLYKNIDAPEFSQNLHLDYILEKSLGIMFHSEYNLTQVNEKYDSYSSKVRLVNFCSMVLPKFDNINRDNLRTKHKIPLDCFVISTFGGVNNLKLIPEIIEVAKYFQCNTKLHFVIIGGGGYLEEYISISKKYGLKNLTFTGRVTHDELIEYYTLTDLALQFRRNSRGETSAVVYDCMALRIPLVVNNYATLSTLSDEYVLKLADNFSNQELIGLINEILAGKYILTEFVNNACDNIISNHNPALVANIYFNNTESFYLESHNKKIKFPHDLVGLELSNCELLARFLAFDADQYRQCVYFDVSEIHYEDLNTGIQRVIKIILKNLINNYSGKHRIIPIYFSNDKCYIANKFISRFMLSESTSGIVDVELFSFAMDSIYLCLDFHWYLINSPVIRSWLIEQKKHSNLYHVQYDLIPITNPEYCDMSVLNFFERNIDEIRNIMDGVIAISKAVADTYIEYFKQINSNNFQRVGYFHLGCDIDNYNSNHHSDLLEDLSMLNGKKFMLMVSTIEPRKGHAQVLEAFDRLWQDGSEYCLVFVGKKGWHVDELIEEISNNPQLNKKLFWLQGISDQGLSKVYELATAFIMASFAEGFGLGIVESAKYNKPLILREIPVFKEIAGNHAYYFDCNTGEELAKNIFKWISLFERGEMPSSVYLQTITWEESCNQLMDVVLNNKCYKVLSND